MSMATLTKPSNSVAISGSPKPRMTFVQWKIFWWSSSGMPIMSQMICSGRGPANAATRSAVPSGLSAIIASTRRLARSRTEPSMRASTRGVNALLTMLRSRVCLGSSIAIIEPKYSANSGDWSPITMPSDELKISGWRLAWKTSSNRVTA